MIAGPNGSGKSTIKSVLDPRLVVTYINPDEIEKEIKLFGFLNLNSFGIQTEIESLKDFFRNSGLLKSKNLVGIPARLKLFHGNLYVQESEIGSYLASVTADFIRHKLLEKRASFTFETVMSSPDKVAFLKKAKAYGYRTYLYFVATADPAINVSRVRLRHEKGGHDVPEEKIVSRYAKSLELLMDAIQSTNRAYVFDNSLDGLDAAHWVEQTWLAEITDGKSIELKSGLLPAWFKHHVLDKARRLVS